MTKVNFGIFQKNLASLKTIPTFVSLRDKKQTIYLYSTMKKIILSSKESLCWHARTYLQFGETVSINFSQG